jgi:hypothetical protein
MRRKTKEMQNVIKQAIQELGNHKQENFTCDIFEIFFKEHVLKM